MFTRTDLNKALTSTPWSCIPDDVMLALDDAFAFLESAGKGMSEDQKVVVLYLAQVANRNHNDTWDHDLHTDSKDAAVRRVAQLLREDIEAYTAGEE